MSLYDQRKAFDADLIEKALKDDDFRKALLADPKAALEKEWGVSLPADLNIAVHQESKHQLHVVLPSAAQAGDELSADELHTDSSKSWKHFGECVLECTQCSNNDTSCLPGDSGEE